MKLVMTLLSDALPASGRSLAGIIDRDVHYDRYGIPFVPAKRIKGILREHAEILEDNALLDLFGKEGEYKEYRDFFIDNGLVVGYDEYRALVASEKFGSFFSPQAVLDFFTYTRAQTAIDESGSAKENSLRVSRVLKRGLVFEFPVEFPEALGENMTNLCKTVRHFGSNRSRGFGEIRLGLESAEEGEVSPDGGVSNVGTRLRVDIENMEPLILSSRSGLRTKTEEYIPGSMLQGALASRYLRKHGEADERFHELFLSGKIVFSNLCPVPKGSRKFYYPSPLSVRKVKESPDPKEIGQYYDLLYQDGEDIKEGTIYKGGLSGVMAYDEEREEIYSHEVGKGVESHHRRPRNRHIAKATENDGEFYQYETLEEGYLFRGSIVAREGTLETIEELLKEDCRIRIGRSKTGQYGKCAISFEREEHEAREELEPNDEITLLCVSDTILLNEFGFASVDPGLFIEALAEKLGRSRDDFELIDYAASTVTTGGFLGVWKMPKLQYDAFRAGTVFRLEYRGSERIELPKTIYLGMRNEEGYGAVRVKELETYEIPQPEPEPLEKAYDNGPVELTPSMRSLLKHRLAVLQRERITAKALEMTESNNGIPNAFLGRLLRFISHAESFEAYNEILVQLASSKQKENLRKVLGPLFIERANMIDIDRFRQKIYEQTREYIEDFDQNEAEGMDLFSAYKHYATTWLNHRKYLNRGAGDER